MRVSLASKDNLDLFEHTFRTAKENRRTWKGLVEHELTGLTELGIHNQMHRLYSRASGMTHDVMDAAIEVHKDKGPGLLESIESQTLANTFHWQASYRLLQFTTRFACCSTMWNLPLRNF